MGCGGVLGVLEMTTYNRPPARQRGGGGGDVWSVERVVGSCMGGMHAWVPCGGGGTGD